MDDTPDPLTDAQCSIALALSEMDVAGEPKTEAGALFVLSARVMLAALAVATGDLAAGLDPSSRL